MDQTETTEVVQLIKDYKVCQLNVNSCESALDKALSSHESIQWYQEPSFIGVSLAVSFLTGLMLGLKR